MKEYQTYIFDLDGTLLNTLDDLAASTNFALRSVGLPEHPVDDIRRFVGNGVRKLMERAIDGGDNNPAFDEAFTLFKQHYMEHGLDMTRPYDGVTDVLAELKAKRKNIAVVSNKFYDATKELVGHFFGQYIEVAIGERENIRKKPAPDTVLEALHRLGVGKEGAVYVGDSDVDFNTAKNVGIPCVSVLWGFRDEAFLRAVGADTFISRPYELVDFSSPRI